MITTNALHAMKRKTSQFVHQNELDFTRFKIEQSSVQLLTALNSYVLFFIPNAFGILKRPCKEIRVPVYLPFHPNKPTHTNNTKQAPCVQVLYGVKGSTWPQFFRLRCHSADPLETTRNLK